MREFRTVSGICGLLTARFTFLSSCLDSVLLQILMDSTSLCGHWNLPHYTVSVVTKQVVMAYAVLSLPLCVHLTDTVRQLHVFPDIGGAMAGESARVQPFATLVA